MACVCARNQSEITHFCIIILNWKPEKCLIDVIAQRPRGHVPQCPIAGDASGVITKFSFMALASYSFILALKNINSASWWTLHVDRMESA